MLFSDRTNGDTDDEKKVEGGYIRLTNVIGLLSITFVRS